MANSSHTLGNSETAVTTTTMAVKSVHDSKHLQTTRAAPSPHPYYYPYQQQSTPLPQVVTMSAAAKTSLPFTTSKSSIPSSSSIITTMPSALSSSYSSTHSYLSTSTSTSISTSSSSSTSTSMSSSYFTWLVFLEERWTPFDAENQKKLVQTLSLGGTFVDITDTNFPHVKRVRVFPKSNYLSYLGVKYRLSRIMQPDAWLDHT